MAKYQTYAIDEASFLEFTKSPSSKLLNKFVKALSSDEQANSFFEEEPPVWAEDAAGWVKGHLRKDDWYFDLTEPEAVAWDGAVDKIVTEFKCGKRVKGTEHGEIHIHIFELAEEMFHGDKSSHQMLRMTPYRFHSLAPEIENAEPYDRIYWPTHAMLDTQQLAALADDLKEVLAKLPSFEISSADIFDTIDERRESAESESIELLSYVDRLLEAKAMWYARIDC